MPSDEDEGDALEREDDAQEGKDRFRGAFVHMHARAEAQLSLQKIV